MAKVKKKKDPHAAREAQKYSHPIPSREFILDHLLSRKKPANLRDLITELELTTEDNKEALRRRIKAMLRDGQLEQLFKKRYWPSGQRVLVEGTVFVDKKNQHWVIPAQPGPRIVLTNYRNFQVYQGNRVIVSVLDFGQGAKSAEKPEGKLIEILEQPSVTVTGRFVSEQGVQYVISHSKEMVQDILIPPGKEQAAEDGQIVVVQVSFEPSRLNEPFGEVLEVLGDEHTRGIEIEAAIRSHGLPYLWPEEVKQEISTLKPVVAAAAKRNRVDLRDLNLVTIDGEDARDFDDAVFCQPKRSGGWRLIVAIADVSHYVKPKSSLDVEAQVRGNSVYFPNKVIPMLPEVLSNGLCSLKPHEDRLCMVCEASISEAGKLTRFKFYEGVMHSKARLTYNQVAQYLEGDSVTQAQLQAVGPQIEDLHELYQALHTERENRGAIDFETVETRIRFGKKGKISSIEPVTRNVAHRIIEECMLCANVATAKFLAKHKIPGLYRNHEAPPTEKLSDLQVFLNELGLSLGHKKGKKPLPIDYSTLLKRIQNRKDAQVIQTVLLRSLCQAVYAPHNLGHFGLAYPAYTHFTSPIRRYPDLVVHRQIRSIIRGKWDPEVLQTDKGAEKVAKLQQRLTELAHHCSVTERRADDATREVVLSLKCQYMMKHIGGIFSGVISGVTRFGFFVELTDFYVDGLVHITSLHTDYFIFDPIHHRLVGEHSGLVYALGMPIQVQVARVDLDERKIDFTLVNTKKAKKK